MAVTANCKNCGAPTDGLRCKYCGTPNDAMMNVPVGKPVKVSLDVGDAVYEFEMVVGQFDMEHDYHNDTYYCCGEPVLRKSVYQSTHVVMGGDVYGTMTMRVKPEKDRERPFGFMTSMKTTVR